MTLFIMMKLNRMIYTQFILARIVMEVKTIKMPIWALNNIFFKFFSPVSESSSNFTISLNYLWEHIVRVKKFLIVEDFLKIWPTVHYFHGYFSICNGKTNGKSDTVTCFQKCHDLLNASSFRLSFLFKVLIFLEHMVANQLFLRKLVSIQLLLSFWLVQRCFGSYFSNFFISCPLQK